MRCTFKTVFYVNGSKERNGIVPIMGRVTINGTIAQFSCKQSVTKAIWDAKGNRAIGKSKEAKEVNFALDNIKAQIAKHYQRLSDREAFVTAEMVRNAYQGIGTEYETLLRAFDKENAAFAKRVGKDRAKNTYRKYLIVRKYVADFIKYQYKRSDMSMNELTEEFIRDYCLYLGSAELLSVHRQRVADVAPHSDDNDEKPPDFGQGKTKFPQELHHVF
uniref:phage integrase SAM-like domain-containing protein n=1 Tax=Leyella stercorea TaxID=363265 RepID=UPI003AF5BD57